MIQARCHTHLERPARAVCVECRRSLCEECTTRADGINRCAACLTRRAAPSSVASNQREWNAANVLLSLLSAAGVFAVISLVATILS